MMSSDHVEEAEALFRALARAIALLNATDLRGSAGGSNGGGSAVLQALRVIEEATSNIEWRDEVAKLLPEPEGRMSDGLWRIDALNSLNATIGRARCAEDPVAAGTIYVRCGMYSEAAHAYAKAPQALLLNSHLHVLQGNWSFVATTLAKQFAAARGRLDNKSLQNLALAYWHIEEYGNCLATLLHLDPTKDGALGRREGGVWLSHKQLRAMLLVCALLQFDRDMLRFFQHSEKLAQFFALGGILQAYADVDTTAFWRQFDDGMQLPAHAASEKPLRLLQDRIHQNWLLLHNKVPLARALEVLGSRRPSYSSLDCVEDLNRWQLPYKVDLVNNWVELAEVRSNSLALADKLVYEYKRDALLLLWHAKRR